MDNSTSVTTPPQSKFAIKENKPTAAKFRSLEDECNWILSGREPILDDANEDDDENTLDDISGDELSDMTIDFNDETNNATTASTHQENIVNDVDITEKQDKPQLKKKERKKYDIHVPPHKSSTTATPSSRYDSSMLSTRLQVNGINHTFNNDDDDEGLYK